MHWVCRGLGNLRLNSDPGALLSHPYLWMVELIWRPYPGSSQLIGGRKGNSAPAVDPHLHPWTPVTWNCCKERGLTTQAELAWRARPRLQGAELGNSCHRLLVITSLGPRLATHPTCNLSNEVVSLHRRLEPRIGSDWPKGRDGQG